MQIVRRSRVLQIITIQYRLISNRRIAESDIILIYTRISSRKFTAKSLCNSTPERDCGNLHTAAGL